MGAPTADVIQQLLSQHPKKTVVDSSLTPAGVMLLLYYNDGQYYILLNRRTHEVEHHKGEVSFPGGRRDEEDATLLDTALRETFEEMGVYPQHVQVLGEIDDLPTNSRFLISPYVGIIPYPYVFRPSQSEVAEVFAVPIPALMDRNNLRDEIRIQGQRLVNSPAYAYQGNLIFGATAKVLTRFLELAFAAPGKEASWSINRCQP